MGASTSWPSIGPTALASRRLVTALGPGVPLPAVPAPDSRGLAFIDHTQRIHVFDRETEASTEIDRGPHMLQ